MGPGRGPASSSSFAVNSVIDVEDSDNTNGVDDGIDDDMDVISGIHRVIVYSDSEDDERDDDEEAFIPLDLCNIDFDEDIEGLPALFNSYKNTDS